jgi:hypothetical protein
MTMALSLSNVTKKAAMQPPIFTLYASAGRGKTTAAASFPDAIFIQTEDGRGALEIASFTDPAMGPGYMTALEEVQQALAEIFYHPHDFKTLVIDTVNGLEALVRDYICRKNNWSSIEQPGYGKGFTLLAEEFERILQTIISIRNMRNMNIVLVGHPEAVTAPDPHRPEYKQYQLRMDKRSGPLVYEKSDIVGFLDMIVVVANASDTKGKQGPAAPGKANSNGQRVLYTQGGNGFEAKQRFGMPDTVLIPHPSQKSFYDTVKQWLPEQGRLGHVHPMHPLAQQAAQQQAAQQQAAQQQAVVQIPQMPALGVPAA